MDLFHKLFGPNRAEVDEAVAKRIGQESRRGANEAVARHLAWCEREYERNPSPINQAGLERARKQMP
jgi:hypothetical protein